MRGFSPPGHASLADGVVPVGEGARPFAGKRGGPAGVLPAGPLVNSALSGCYSAASAIGAGITDTKVRPLKPLVNFTAPSTVANRV